MTSESVHPDKPYHTFNISICTTTDNKRGKYILAGFQDALNDYGAIDNYAFTYRISERIPSSGDLLFAIGEDALSSALGNNLGTPIVMADVINYYDYTYPDESGELKRDFTGVVSLPNTELLLSTLIESTPDLQAVALLYSTEDTNAIFQNELLERMLNDAKIPWKEYEFSPKEESSEISENFSTFTIITPKPPHVDSAREGELFELEALNDSGVLVGLNKSSSARAALTSYNWDENKKLILSDNISDEPEDLLVDTQNPFEATISKAASECSAIFIPTKSSICDYAEIISEIAIPLGVTTITNDNEAGQFTLCATYTDPYDQGYRAGKQAYRILVGNTAIEDIPISGTTWENSFKLYQNKYSEILSIEFPKSFFEADAFLSSYKEGSNTSRPQLSKTGENGDED